MKKRLLILMALILTCCMVVTACSNPLTSLKAFFNKKTPAAVENNNMIQDEGQPSLSEVAATQPEDSRPTVMYYRDSDFLLVPVMRYVPKGETGIAKATINAMVFTDELAENLKPTGLAPTLPGGTKIIGAKITEDGAATIDFSEEFLSFSNAKAEAAGVKSVVYALTEFSNIKSVQIKVNGKILDKLQNGTDVSSAMKRSDINLQSSENTGDNPSKVMVYYQKKGSGNFTYFVPVTKAVTGYKNRAEAAINALLQGPAPDSGLINPFPEGTKLLGVQVKDGIAFVNFSQDILPKDISKAREREMIKAVTLTMKELNKISKVKFFINGKTVENTSGLGADEYVDVPVFVNYYE